MFNTYIDARFPWLAKQILSMLSGLTLFNMSWSQPALIKRGGRKGKKNKKSEKKMNKKNEE